MGSVTHPSRSLVKRLLIAASLLTLAACTTGPGTGSPIRSYFLSAVDGKPLPSTVDLPDGYQLVTRTLTFPVGGRPRTNDATGTVEITDILRTPDQQNQHSTTQYRFSVIRGELHIDLCPPLALCLVLQNELVGTLSDQPDLILTHYLGGQARSVYHYFAALPD